MDVCAGDLRFCASKCDAPRARVQTFRAGIASCFLSSAQAVDVDDGATRKRRIEGSAFNASARSFKSTIRIEQSNAPTSLRTDKNGY